MEGLLVAIVITSVFGLGWYGYGRMQANSNKQPKSSTVTTKSDSGDEMAQGSIIEGSVSIWAGYVVSGHTFSSVEGRVKVPRVTCITADDGVSVWTGIDGYMGDTVEQIGFTADCHDASNVTKNKPINGVTYYAWAQMFGAGAYDGSIDLPIYPEDVIYYNVTYIGDGNFKMTIRNETLDKTKTVSYKCKPDTAQSSSDPAEGCPRVTAEWIIERSGNSSLAKFNEITLYDNRVTTNEGKAHTPGSIETYQLDMIQDGEILAKTGALLPRSDFTVKWVNTGEPGE